MANRGIGIIDCDVHLPSPGTKDLLPYLSDYWRDIMVSRGIDGLSLMSDSMRVRAALRPEMRATIGTGISSFVDALGASLQRQGTSHAVCTCLYGAQGIFNEDLGAALTSAANDWVRNVALERNDRLRGSILVNARNPERAAEEIERVATDKRFVQVLLMVSGPMPLGRRPMWPIYRAAVRHNLTIGVHAGSLNQEPSSAIGWSSSYLEEYAGQAFAFQHQLLSLIFEGVFSEFPDLKVVFLESGFAWLPSFLWRADKSWRGLRMETPWLKQPPSDVVRSHVRFSTQPADSPPSVAQLERTIEQMDSDRLLLFATDFPHWHYDGDDALPAGMSAELVRKITIENPREAYPRLS